MMRVNRLQSAIVMIVSVLLVSLLAYVEFYFMQNSAYPRPILKLIASALMMGWAFGSFAWCSITVPNRLPPAAGWRRQVARGILWWLILVCVGAWMRIFFDVRLSIGDFAFLVIMSLTFVLMGWGLGMMRAQRAEALGVKRY